MQVDLLYHTPVDFNRVTWTLGEKRALHGTDLHHSYHTLQALLASTDADFVLFWDYAYGDPPSPTRLIELVQGKVDAWHGGLRMGLQGKPALLNYVNPIWMYNLDPPPEIASTSFRMSLHACLIRTRMLRTLGGFDAAYDNYHDAGIDLGYQILKKGGIIRYHPEFLQKATPAIPETALTNQFRFIKKFSGNKWLMWAALRYGFDQGRFLMAFRQGWQHRKTRTVPLIPCLNASPSNPTRIEPAPQISVLAPTLKRYTYTLNQLEQLAKQTLLPTEVLITDQTPPDERIEDLPIHDFGLSVRYFPQTTMGQCVAWNKLLEEAEGEYVLFLGDDADGIRPDFIAQLFSTMQAYEADMVAAHVKEVGIVYDQDVQDQVKLSDTFPITLVKKALIDRAGRMHMFYNQQARADHDLALRCHQQGVLMVFDYGAPILHHRAPAGGLRTHKARTITHYMSRTAITKFALPTSAEMYLAHKFFGKAAAKEERYIRLFALFSIRGGVLKRFLRSVVVILRLPQILTVIRRSRRTALQALEKGL